jgi:hypothetical protein
MQNYARGNNILKTNSPQSFILVWVRSFRVDSAVIVIHVTKCSSYISLIYSLFNDAIIISDYIESSGRMIDELENMQKEAAVA